MKYLKLIKIVLLVAGLIAAAIGGALLMTGILIFSGRIASINDLPISESQRKFHWPMGP